MKAYLLTTGTIFALFAVTHVFVTYEHFRQIGAERWWVLAPVVVLIGSTLLAVWAFRLARRAGAGY